MESPAFFCVPSSNKLANKRKKSFVFLVFCFRNFLFFSDGVSENTTRLELCYALASISSTLNEQIFCTNVCFGSFYYVLVTRKKLPKWRSYEKSARFALMKLTPCCERWTMGQKSRGGEDRLIDVLHKCLFSPCRDVGGMMSRDLLHNTIS